MHAWISGFSWKIWSHCAHMTHAEMRGPSTGPELDLTHTVSSPPGSLRGKFFYCAQGEEEETQKTEGVKAVSNALHIWDQVVYI